MGVGLGSGNGGVGLSGNSGGGGVSFDIDAFSGTTEGWTEDVGTWGLIGATAGYQTGTARLNSGTSADGDKISVNFSVPETGQYFAYLLHALNADLGIVDIKLDGGSSLLAIDGYAASLTKNVLSAAIDFGTLAASTQYEISITLNGKNASSTDFLVVFQKVIFIKQ